MEISRPDSEFNRPDSNFNRPRAVGPANCRSLSTDRYWIDPEIGTDRVGDSTRLTRIHTDFWNGLVELCESGYTGPFLKLDRSTIDPA